MHSFFSRPTKPLLIPIGPYFRSYSTKPLNTFLKDSSKSAAGIGGLSLLANCLNRPEYADRLLLISRKDWIFKIDPFWYKAFWGQTVRYLPIVLQKLATKELKLDANEQLSFEDMKNLSEVVRTTLINQHYTIIDKELKKLTQKGNAVELLTAQSEIIQAPADLVINFAREHITRLTGLQVRSGGEIYSIDGGYKSVEPIIMDGMGQNTIWALRDFGGKRPITVLIYPEDGPARPEMMEQIFEINRHHKNSPEFHCSLILVDEHSNIECNDKEIVIQGIDLVSNKPKLVEASIEHVFASRGFKLAQDLVVGDHVRHIQSPKYQTTKVLCVSANRMDIIAPITVVPPGNLADMTAIVSVEFGCTDFSDYSQVPSKNIWREKVVAHATKIGYRIDQSFFENVQQHFQENARCNVPRRDQFERVIERLFVGQVTDDKGQKIKLSWRAFCEQGPKDNLEYSEMESSAPKL